MQGSDQLPIADARSHRPEPGDQNAPVQQTVGSKRKASPTRADSSEDVVDQPRRLRQKTCTMVVSSGRAAPSPLPTLRFSKAPPRPSSAQLAVNTFKGKRRPLRTLSRAGMVPAATSRYAHVEQQRSELFSRPCRLLALGNKHDATPSNLVSEEEFQTLLPISTLPIAPLGMHRLNFVDLCCSLSVTQARSLPLHYLPQSELHRRASLALRLRKRLHRKSRPRLSLRTLLVRCEQCVRRIDDPHCTTDAAEPSAAAPAPAVPADKDAQGDGGACGVQAVVMCRFATCPVCQGLQRLQAQRKRQPQPCPQVKRQLRVLLLHLLRLRLEAVLQARAWLLLKRQLLLVSLQQQQRQRRPLRLEALQQHLHQHLQQRQRQPLRLAALQVPQQLHPLQHQHLHVAVSQRRHRHQGNQQCRSRLHSETPLQIHRRLGRGRPQRLRLAAHQLHLHPTPLHLATPLLPTLHFLQALRNNLRCVILKKYKV